MNVSVHVSTSPISRFFHWASWIIGRQALTHVVVSVGDVALESSPQRGTQFVPTKPWLRAAQPFHSVDVGEVESFHFRDYSHLEGHTISPMAVLINRMMGRPGLDCVYLSVRFLRELGIDVPEWVTTPRDIIEWSMNQ